LKLMSFPRRRESKSHPRRRVPNLLLLLALLLFSASAAAYSINVPDFNQLERQLRLKPAQKAQFDVAVAASQRALMSVALAGLQAKERMQEEFAKPFPDLDTIFRAQADIVELSAPLFRDAGAEWERLYRMLDRAQVDAAKRFIEDQLGPFLK
jgi:hypothetical protein